MNDPYKTLNIGQNASDEEIKKAYRDLARKYHPDNYVNNPLADLAQEKMKEINEAYDTINKQRGSGQGGGSSSSDGYNNGSDGYRGANGGSGMYSRIRALLASNNLVQAERELGAITERNAEWNFLMGSLFYKKGWLDEALRYFNIACTMDPGNREYAQALSMMRAGGSPYRSAPGGMGFGGSPCDLCSSLICADCCCECAGGDLISCC